MGPGELVARKSGAAVAEPLGGGADDSCAGFVSRSCIFRFSCSAFDVHSVLCDLAASVVTNSSAFRYWSVASLAVALAWTIRSGHVIAIPESGSVAPVKENAVALSLTLTPQELQTLDAAYPLPSR